ncbi:transposase [Streptomyces phaeochromogenes]|uniref:transposase n=1 Tax=Streptomyces phaeochromogenes TaxID=1923 RepID=UPI0033FAD024
MLPSFAVRPQGGGTAPYDERAVFTAAVYALTSGCARRHLPPPFGTSPATAHRRFTVWTEAGLWRRLHRAVLDELGVPGEVGWTTAAPTRRTPHGQGDFSAEHLAWLRERGLAARIARPGIESGERLGRHRWKIERSIARLFPYRRLTVRYERKGSHGLAFPGLAAAPTCYKKLAKLAT